MRRRAFDAAVADELGGHVFVLRLAEAVDEDPGTVEGWKLVLRGRKEKAGLPAA